MISETNHPRAAEVTRLGSEAVTLAVDADRKDLASVVREEEDRVRTGAARVVVIGEKKRGKSSLINALIGRPKLLPVDADVATSVHLVVGYASEDRAVVVDDKHPDGAKIPLAAIAEYAALDPQTGTALHTDVMEVEVRLPEPLLAAGLELIDTPGVGGLVAGHVTRTLATLERADALLFVVDGQSELTKSECEFLRQATERVATVVFVLTKKDLYPAWEAVLAKNLELIRSSAARFADAPWFVVSSLAATEAVKAATPEIRQRLTRQSGFGPLEDALRDTVAARAEALRLANVVQVARAVIRQMGVADEERRRALQRDPDLVAAVERQQRELTALKQQDASWRRTLGGQLDQLSSDLQLAVTRLASDLSLVAQHRVAGGGTTMLGALQADMEQGVEGIMMELQNLFSKGATRILAEVDREFATGDIAGSGVRLTCPDRLRVLPPLIVSRTTAGHKWLVADDMLNAAAGTGMVAAMAGALAGAATLNPLVGAAVMTGTGALLAWRRQARDKLARDRLDARQYIQSILTEVRSELPPVLRERIREFAAVTEAEVTRQLDARHTELAATLTEHQQALAMSDDQLAGRRAALDARLARLRAADQLAIDLEKELATNK
jgi:GTP-binding protein EngB required for normal cell division